MRSRTFTLLIGSLTLPLALVAQSQVLFAQQLSDVSLRNDCRLARQVLVHGQPANKYDWALRVIEDCGTDGAGAIAHELRDLRGLTRRTTPLDQLSESAHRLIDVALFEVAMEIGADETAGEAARIHSIRLLTLQVAHINLPYEALTTDPMVSGRIILGPVTSRGPSLLRELPRSACRDGLELLQRLAVVDSNPTIRLAADQTRYAVEAHCFGPEPG